MLPVLFCFVFLALHVGAIKVFEPCELIEELHWKHNVAEEDLIVHICKAEFSGFQTNFHHEGENLFGLYAISDFWCDIESAGGLCNMTCSDFLDDDISDDVECQSTILRAPGIDLLDDKEELCLTTRQKSVNKCLASLTERLKNDNESFEKTSPGEVPVKSEYSVRDIIIAILATFLLTLAMVFLCHFYLKPKQRASEESNVVNMANVEMETPKRKGTNQ